MQLEPMKPQDNWRLFGQDQYLQGLELAFRQYSSSPHSHPSAHCEFCSREFAEFATGPDVVTEGYSSHNGFRWICRICFDDFRDEFKWRVTES
jgi:hypothetical protein